MGLHIVRFEKNQRVSWGVLNESEITTLKGDYNTLADFLENGIEEAQGLAEENNHEVVQVDEVKVLSPVTQPTQIVCQGANYSNHRAEAGMDAARPPFNMIFNKAASSICEANADIIYPENVKLLDYEIELGLIIGKDIKEAHEVTDDNLHEYVAGLVITNDISALDIQLPQGQFVKGKSYRTFCPVGPILYLLDREDIPYIHNLELKLSVNNEVRQEANTEQLLFKPAETLTELTGIMDFNRGDLLLTGTAGGVALQLSGEVMNEISNPFNDPQKKMDLLVESQLNNERYLQIGDVIHSEIKSPDGKISLGIQVNKIVSQN